MTADESFAKSLMDSVKTFAKNPDMVGVFSNLYNNTMETIKFCEMQETERTKIREESKRRIAQINSQRDFILTYLDKTFDERRYQFKRYFDTLDCAIQQNNPQLMATCLQNISTLSTSSPFRPLIEAQQEYKEIAAGKKLLDF